MSGLAKGVKKAFKSVTNIVKEVGSKLNSVRKKVMKSKIFKVALVAATVYFGGAALMSVMGGGTAAAGVGSAWGGITSAGSQLAAGNISGAFSAIGSGFTGAGAAGTSTAALTAAGEVGAGFGAQAAAGAQYTGGMIANNAAIANTAGTIAAGAGAAPTISGNTATNLAVNETGKAASGGLLGEAGKAALITGGMNMAGSMIAGKAEADAAEEQQKRRTYWGVDGEGNQVAGGGGLLDPTNFGTYQPLQPPQTQPWQTSLDGLINRQKQLLGQG